MGTDIFLLKNSSCSDRRPRKSHSGRKVFKGIGILTKRWENCNVREATFYITPRKDRTLKTENLNICLLTEEEREKIETLKLFEDTGLYGQFTHATLAYDHWKENLARLFDQAEEMVLTILGAPEFKRYRDYARRPGQMALISPSLDQIIDGSVTRSHCMYIWSVLERGTNNNLMLMITGGKDGKTKLCLCTAQYLHQNEHMSHGIHWYRSFDDNARLEVDSFRLHQALTVLANPHDAWKYLRARIHSIELSAQ